MLSFSSKFICTSRRKSTTETQQQVKAGEHHHHLGRNSIRVVIYSIWKSCGVVVEMDTKTLYQSTYSTWMTGVSEWVPIVISRGLLPLMYDYLALSFGMKWKLRVVCRTVQYVNDSTVCTCNDSFVENSVIITVESESEIERVSHLIYRYGKQQYVRIRNTIYTRDTASICSVDGSIQRKWTLFGTTVQSLRKKNRIVEGVSHSMKVVPGRAGKFPQTNNENRHKNVLTIPSLQYGRMDGRCSQIFGHLCCPHWESLFHALVW